MNEHAVQTRSDVGVGAGGHDRMTKMNTKRCRCGMSSTMRCDRGCSARKRQRRIGMLLIPMPSGQCLPNASLLLASPRSYSRMCAWLLVSFTFMFLVLILDDSITFRLSMY